MGVSTFIAVVAVLMADLLWWPVLDFWIIHRGVSRHPDLPPAALAESEDDDRPKWSISAVRHISADRSATPGVPTSVA